jgi:molybdate transport system permease protein
MAEQGATALRDILSIRVRHWFRLRHTLVLISLSAPILLFLLVPMLALVIRIDLDSLLANVADPRVARAISLSAITTSLTTLIAVIGGTPVAYLLARRQFRGRVVLDTLIDLPMVLPPAVAGIALLITFGRRGIIGQYLVDAGLSIAFTQTAVVLAQTFVAAPFYVKAAAAGFAGVERELEQAAAIDGASSLRVFSSVTLPLARTALLGGLVMTWARALGEFGATIIFAGNFPGRTQTMPLAIYLGFELDFNIALTLSVILLTTSFVVLFIVKRILGRSITP